jgi:hypothetical protein
MEGSHETHLAQPNRALYRPPRAPNASEMPRRQATKGRGSLAQPHLPHPVTRLLKVIIMTTSAPGPVSSEAPQRGAPSPAVPTWPLPVPLRTVLLIVPPLLLAGLEVLHPQPEPTTQAMLDASTWFAAFHVIQLALIGLVALSVLLLADGLGRAATWVTRLGIGTFMVFFSAYDAVAGIGTGLAMRTARDLSATQQDGVLAVVKDWPALGPVFALGIVGSLGWLVAVGALALAARRQGASRPVWISLALAAVFLVGGHPFPFGTLAFGFLAVAAALHEWSRAATRQGNGA